MCDNKEESGALFFSRSLCTSIEISASKEKQWLLFVTYVPSWNLLFATSYNPLFSINHKIFKCTHCNYGFQQYLRLVTSKNCVWPLWPVIDNKQLLHKLLLTSKTLLIFHDSTSYFSCKRRNQIILSELY